MKYNLYYCPFCGGQPYIENHCRVFIKGKSERAAFVRCKECEARTGKVPVSVGNRKAVDMAVSLWNRRYNCVSMTEVSDHSGG